MGIKHLNALLMQKCSHKSIYTASLDILRGRTVAVDAYIYLYKFQEFGDFGDNIENMLSIMLYYKITPVFVFDGKPPDEKRDLIAKRVESKKRIEATYVRISKKLEDSTGDARTLLESELKLLKNTFLRVTREHILTAKRLLDSYGVHYIDALGEADATCARLVLSGDAWACLSNDMDMLVYGCRRVLRDLNLVSRTVDIYDMKSILQDMNMPMKLFREVMVISGTDYNMNNSTDLSSTMKWVSEYRCRCRMMYADLSFYDWLEQHTTYICNRAQLDNIYTMFAITIK
jgi:flap endonuclease-1